MSSSRRINFAVDTDGPQSCSSQAGPASAASPPSAATGGTGLGRAMALYPHGEDDEDDDDDEFAALAPSAPSASATKRTSSFPSAILSTSPPSARLNALQALHSHSSSPAIPQGAPTSSKKPRTSFATGVTTIPSSVTPIGDSHRSGAAEGTVTPTQQSMNPFDMRAGPNSSLRLQRVGSNSTRKTPSFGGSFRNRPPNGFPRRGEVSSPSDVESADPDANFFRMDSLKMDDSDNELEGFHGSFGGGGRSGGHGRNLSSTTGRVDLRPSNIPNGQISPSAIVTGQANASGMPANIGTKGIGVRKGPIADEVLGLPPKATADSDEGRERIEWQTMLASVLGGEILKGEKSRIGGERPVHESFKKELGAAYWWQIRARLRGRTEEEERRRTKERRDRTVDAILEEVERFKVQPPLLEDDDEKRDGIQAVESEQVQDQIAMEQILAILSKLSLAESLYPNTKTFRAEKPLYDSSTFQARVDALASWSTVVHMLQNQVAVLQKWTGSKELDITKPNTTAERALVGKSRYHPLDSKGRDKADQAADDSTFIERVLKEDSLRSTFNKRAMLDMYQLVYTAKQTVIDYRDIFVELGLELGLAGYRNEIVMLIAFPARLIVEALRVRLDAASKLVDPSALVIDDMIANFRTSLELACQVKQQYLQIVEPDPDAKWDVPHCLGEEYDQIIVDALRMFFKLLHWKLKSGGKEIYFRETDILNGEWDFLNEVATCVEGGDVVVAEHYSSLTNKLMIRVISYFETQLRVPMARGKGANPKQTSNNNVSGDQSVATQRRNARDLRPMDTAEMVQWFSKILDAVRLRYRKLQSFARRLTQRFDNSAEYDLENVDLDLIIESLVDTDHFLVYTRAFEEEGTYIIAEQSLRERPDLIHNYLFKAYSDLPVTSRRQGGWGKELDIDIDAIAGSGEDVEEAISHIPAYLLVLTPRRKFVWTGAVMQLDLPLIDLGVQDNRIRLVADGPFQRLVMAKESFASVFVEPGFDEPFLTLDCLVEQQAHLPKLQRELKRISKSTHRLSECVVESVAHVRRALGSEPGTQDLIENWYAFASDHGYRAGVHMDHATWSRFSRLLMRLAISWVAFICDSCDPTDRKTFRWAVNALEYAMVMTRGNNILHLEQSDFALLRSKVASCMALLISHFDILGARSSFEAKKEAEKLEAIRRLQRMHEAFDDAYGLSAVPSSPPDADPAARISRLFQEVHGSTGTDRSIRLVREERVRLIAALEQAREGTVHDQHMVGQVLDEQVSEDRSLVFLASSTSNIALRWQQGGFIGGGANGNVYIGFNLDSGGIMAVKEIRVQDMSNTPALYKQIKDESDVMQMLSHPNIVDYYGIEVHRDRVYIFEEYCEGGSLANLLEHGRIEDEDVILVYALQMLQGLEYLHSKGVEHRDVKPDNILLGANSTIKFVDFGAAKVIIKGNRTMARSRARGAGGVDGVPAMNSMAGTPMYMAPEVIKNEKTGRLGAMDIWSLGCVILEFATGRKPWSNLDNEWAIMFHIGISTQHPPLPEPGQLSELGIDFIEQCLTLDPQLRPTASELLKHPWLSNTVQLLLEHTQQQQDSYLGGSQSLSSTLVNSDTYDSVPLAVQLAAVKDQAAADISEDLSSFSSTPNHDESPSGYEATFDSTLAE